MNYEKPKVEGIEEGGEKKMEKIEGMPNAALTMTPQQIDAMIADNQKRIEALKNGEGATKAALEGDRKSLGLTEDVPEAPSVMVESDEIALLEKQNESLLQQKQIAEILQDPKKREQFESLMANLGGMNDEQLAKVQETGVIEQPKAEAGTETPDNKGVDFNMSYHVSPEAMKEFAGIVKEGGKAAGEIIGKIPPELLMALLV